MIYCVECGNRIEIEGKVCPHCGKINNLSHKSEKETLNGINNPKDRARDNSKLEGMILVEGGSFEMGSRDYNDEKIHTVKLSSFYIGKYQVTQKEWAAVMKNNPSYFKGENLPVEGVSWYDATDFCNKLSEKESLEKCYSGSEKNIVCDFSKNGYRLPTEAEWEYAARGGKYSEGYEYSGSDDLNEVAWFRDNSESRTHPVGQKKANELGLYDMSGNLWEWCNDWYDNDYYSNSPGSNPRGASHGDNRVHRGGSWHRLDSYCRISFRNGQRPTVSHDNLGFRVVRSK